MSAPDSQCDECDFLGCTGCADTCGRCGDEYDPSTACDCEAEDAGPEYRTRHHADQDDRDVSIHRDERGNA